MSLKPVSTSSFAYREYLSAGQNVKFEFEDMIYLHQLTLQGDISGGSSPWVDVEFYQPGSFANIDSPDEPSPILILRGNPADEGFLLNPYTASTVGTTQTLYFSQPLPACMTKGAVMVITNQGTSGNLEVFLTTRA